MPNLDLLPVTLISLADLVEPAPGVTVADYPACYYTGLELVLYGDATHEGPLTTAPGERVRIGTLIDVALPANSWAASMSNFNRGGSYGGLGQFIVNNDGAVDWFAHDELTADTDVQFVAQGVRVPLA